MADELAFNIRFCLINYLAVQGWCQRQTLGWRLLTLLICIVVPAIGIPLIDGVPFGAIFYIAFYQWRFYAIFILGLFAFILLLPYLIVVLMWLFRRVSRENRVTLSRENITFSSADWNLGAPWSKVSSILRTKSAYVIRTKKLVMRLPLRELTDADRCSFEDFVKGHAPQAAIKF